MQALSTTELERYIKSLYDRTRSITEPDGIFIPLSVHFAVNRHQDGNGNFCFSDKQGYHFREIEKGIIQRDIVTHSLSEIVFLAVEDNVFWMSVNYEAKHRVPNQDSRRLMFSKRLQIYSAIGQEYALKAAQNIQEAIDIAPLQDELFRN